MNPDNIKKMALYVSILSAILLITLIGLGFPGYAYAFPLHGFLISMSVYLLYKKNFKATLQELGVPCPSSRLVIYACLGLVASIVVGTVIEPVLFFLNINDLWKVSEKVLEAPQYIAMLLFIVPPISEELFFRGFLMKRIGILGSTVIFALAHFFYGSVANIVFTFFVGLVFAYLYKKSGSLLPGILAHAAYNFMAVMAVLNSG